MVSGIYVIENAVNNHRYVGSAMNLRQRWSVHLHRLRLGTHHNRHLQYAWVKYGEHVFTFEILEEWEPEFLISMEQWWINMLHPEYNIAPRAGNCMGIACSDDKRSKISSSLMGHPVSEELRTKMRQRVASKETRRKIGLAGIGRSQSQETRIRRSKSLKGHRCSPETKHKIATAHMGRRASPETVEKLKMSHLGNKSHLGFRHSAEVRAKISAAVKAAYLAHPELCANMSAQRKGRKLTEECRVNMSAAQRSRVISPEEHTMRSASVKASWVKRHETGSARNV